ncbi:MAG: hypothetical protein N2645_13740 [Clostridia bacterium]|nr:hypothetical protein [Clostridia bacterium]
MKKTVALVLTASIFLSFVLPYNYAQGSGRPDGELKEKISKASFYPDTANVKSFRGKQRDKGICGLE